MGSNTPPPKIVNGKADEQKVAVCFAEHFLGACSSEARSKQLVNEYCNRQANYCCNANLLNLLDYLVSVELIDKSISKLKFGKIAALDQLTSEHLIHCHPIIALFLTKLFNLMVMFEYVRNGFARSILVPIFKVDIGKKIILLQATEKFR